MQAGPLLHLLNIILSLQDHKQISMLLKGPRSSTLDSERDPPVCSFTLMVSFVVQGANIRDLYNETRGEGLNAEVKRRILMGTYALSAGYYDAYYKRAQQVCPHNSNLLFVACLASSPQLADICSHASAPAQM